MVGAGWTGAAIAFLAVGLGTLSLALFVEWVRQVRGRRKVVEQLRRLTDEGMGSNLPDTDSLYRRAPGRDPRWLRDATEHMPRVRDLRAHIEQADLHWSVQTYLTLACGFALAGGLLVYIPTGSLLFALPVAALGSLIPHVYVQRKRTRRLRAFEEHLPETIDLLGRALRAGHPLTAGLRMVAEEASEPAATEFRRVFEEQRFGMPLDESLYALADRVPLVDVRIFLSAVLVQREVGGNLAEILDKLASVIRARFTLQRQLRVITAQGRMSGYILGVFPVALGFMMLALNTDAMIRFVTSTGGRYLMLGAGFMQIVGFLWIRKIVDIKM
ncbi:MAG TPA: type II secretion system F family protein [Longimicrobiaceae bacterium]